MDTKTKGNVTELKCILKLTELGFKVSKPVFDDARYDLIIDTGKRLLKIQVKTSVWSKDKSAFSFNGYSQHSLGKANKRMKYTNKDIDFFMTEKEEKYYLYPAEEKGFSQKILRIKSKQKQPSIKNAEDFEIEKIARTF